MSATITSTTTPATALGTVYQPNTTHDTELVVDVRIVAAATVALGSIGRIDLLCDAANPPTTIVDTFVGGLGAGFILGGTFGGHLCTTVPAGSRYKLVATNETGSVTSTITRAITRTRG